MKGTVVRKRDEGYGFIKPEEGDKDLFFHASSVVESTTFDDIKEGDAVTYDLEEGPKGPAATNVAPAAASTDTAEETPATEETTEAVSEEAGE